MRGASDTTYGHAGGLRSAVFDIHKTTERYLRTPVMSVMSVTSTICSLLVASPIAFET